MCWIKAYKGRFSALSSCIKVIQSQSGTLLSEWHDQVALLCLVSKPSLRHKKFVPDTYCVFQEGIYVGIILLYWKQSNTWSYFSFHAPPFFGGGCRTALWFLQFEESGRIAARIAAQFAVNLKTNFLG